MKYFLLYLLLSSLAVCSESDVAISKSIEAIYSYPKTKAIVDFQTKNITKQLNIDEETAKNIAITAYIIQSKKISTEKISNIQVNTDFGLFRPDFNYNYVTNEKSTTIKYKWSFE
jgi:hypothetical protein